MKDTRPGYEGYEAGYEGYEAGYPGLPVIDMKGRLQMQLKDIVNHPAYPFASAVTAIAVGIGIGFLVDRLCSKEKPEEDYGDGYEDLPLPEIPEGVNVVSERKVVEDKLFVKPDISKMKDYTKYYDSAKNYSNAGKAKAEEAQDAPENELEDPRFELIDEQEFVKGIGNEDGYVTASSTYFTQDKVLAGWNEDLLERDIQNTVGWRAIRMFDSNDVKAVYVRNSELKVLYEIVRCDDLMEEVLQENLKIESDRPVEGDD